MGKQKSKRKRTKIKNNRSRRQTKGVSTTYN